MRRTAATVFASAPRPIRTVTPSISTSILPEVRSTRRVRLRRPPRTARSSNGAATTAGTNCGVSVSLPDAAWGNPVSQATLLSAHRAAWQLARADRNHDMRAVLLEADPVRRIGLALTSSLAGTEAGR